MHLWPQFSKDEEIIRPSHRFPVVCLQMLQVHYKSLPYGTGHVSDCTLEHITPLRSLETTPCILLLLANILVYGFLLISDFGLAFSFSWYPQPIYETYLIIYQIHPLHMSILCPRRLEQLLLLTWNLTGYGTNFYKSTVYMGTGHSIKSTVGLLGYDERLK